VFYTLHNNWLCIMHYEIWNYSILWPCFIVTVLIYNLIGEPIQRGPWWASGLFAITSILFLKLTRSQSNLAKAAPNDPAHSACTADLSHVWQTDRLVDRQTALQILVTIVCISCSLIIIMYMILHILTNTLDWLCNFLFRYFVILLLNDADDWLHNAHTKTKYKVF